MGLIRTSQEHDFGVMIDSFIKISVQSSVAVKKSKSNVKKEREETEAKTENIFVLLCKFMCP